MKPEDLDSTLPLSEQLVRDAWNQFVAGGPRLVSIPAFLNWLRDTQPELLNVVSKAALVKIASRLHAEGARAETHAAP